MAETGLEGKVGQVNEEQVRKDVNACLDLLAGHLGASVPRQLRPKISIVAAQGDPQLEAGSYDPEKNEICVSGNDGAEYCEECAHYLRNLLVGEIGQKLAGIVASDLSFGETKRVQEFFGRLGESLGRNLAAGTELGARIFSTPERRWLSEEELTSHFKYLRYLLAVKEEMDGLSGLASVLRAHYNILLKSCSEFTSGKIDADLFRRKNVITNNIFATKYNQHKPTLAACKFLGMDVSDAIRNYIRCTENYIERAQNGADTREDMEELSGAHINLLNLVDGTQYILADEIYFAHILGYVAAEDFVKKNPDFAQQASALFRMPARDVLKNMGKQVELQKYVHSIMKKVGEVDAT